MVRTKLRTTRHVGQRLHLNTGVEASLMPAGRMNRTSSRWPLLSGGTEWLAHPATLRKAVDSFRRRPRTLNEPPSMLTCWPEKLDCFTIVSKPSGEIGSRDIGWLLAPPAARTGRPLV